MFGGALVGSVVLLPCLLIGRLFGIKARIPAESQAETGVETGVEMGVESAAEPCQEDVVQFGAQVPFGPMLAVAGLIYFLGFHIYVDAYLADIAASFFGQ